ncbi:MobC family plasmid mobilization relaxosome protein [Kitasatospora sp. NPDC092039]|uniref:MobC family plasmid mobilization relaxosome protein n=1 Tax=Kitasatospora sp. NPDC092039 TaxID=3364086 RepID=UPI0038098AEC
MPTKGEKQQNPPPAEAVRAATRRRLRQPVPRTNRVCPRFSDPEWSLLQHAAEQAGLTLGGYTAAAAVAAAASIDPNAAVADYRRGIQELMESNRQLGAVGNNLNQVAHFLNAGGQPAADLRQLLHRVEAAIAAVDEAVAWMVRR